MSATDGIAQAVPGRRAPRKARIGAEIRDHAHRLFLDSASAAWSADRDLGRSSALRILEVGLQGLEDGLRP